MIGAHDFVTMWQIDSRQTLNYYHQAFKDQTDNNESYLALSVSSPYNYCCDYPGVACIIFLYFTCTVNG